MSVFNLNAEVIKHTVQNAGWKIPHEEMEAGYKRSSANGVFIFHVSAVNKKPWKNGERYVAVVGETPHFILPTTEKTRHVWFDIPRHAFLFHDLTPMDNMTVEGLDLGDGFDRIREYVKFSKMKARHNRLKFD